MMSVCVLVADWLRGDTREVQEQSLSRFPPALNQNPNRPEVNPAATFIDELHVLNQKWSCQKWPGSTKRIAIFSRIIYWVFWALIGWENLAHERLGNFASQTLNYSDRVPEKKYLFQILNECWGEGASFWHRVTWPFDARLFC